MADRTVRTAIGLLVCVACHACVRSPTPPRPATTPCVPRATWVTPTTRAPVPTAAVARRARSARIVLLGERHDWIEDHRWQAHVLSVLHATHPSVVVGFEMLTPDADAALARWAAGVTAFDRLLAETDWRRTTGLDPDLYRPVFEAVRLLGLGARGINTERALVRRVAAVGWNGLDDDERGRLATPRPADEPYRVRLADAFSAHRCRRPDDDDPAFERFVEAQRTWDAVMAGALARLADASPDALVIGIVGRGHAEHRDGIASDLLASGRDALVLLPWETTTSCAELVPGIADAVFGITPLANELPPPPPSLCPDGQAAGTNPQAAQRPR